jgi:glycosyltransferase involved in cell wall biosynthesis
MQILFIHANFPSQFKHLAPALAADPQNVVMALTMQKDPPADWEGVRQLGYYPKRGPSPATHSWGSDFETKMICGEACMRAAQALKEEGFMPDVIIAHPGRGESLFLKQVWPNAKLAIYCDFFHQAEGGDYDFDPEFPKTNMDENCHQSLRNTNNLLHMHIADAGISPTYYQANAYPEPFRSKITVSNLGIDTDKIAPNPNIVLNNNGKFALQNGDEVITFVNRNLEPFRGFHIFMRALPQLLKRRPHAHVLMVGADDVGYGARSVDGKKWKDIFTDEVRPQISDDDWERVHFLGNIPSREFISMLQMSTVHVYLTYPYVLSWSLIEAMSAGCTIVASNTAPLQEVIEHDVNGRLVDFFDVDGLAEEICTLLDDPESRARLSANARAFAQANYDLKTVCLPQQMEWVRSLGAAKTDL